MSDSIPSEEKDEKINRRNLLASGASAVAVGLAGCSGGGGSGGGDEGDGDSGDSGDGSQGTTVGDSGGTEYADTLKILMWPYYDLDMINEPFREEYGISVETAYFNGNSEAYNQLRTGGAEEFDIVMADSFWPQQYYQDDLIQPVDRERLNLDNVFPTFHPDNLDLHVTDDGQYLGPPNAWGGYGLTYNPEKVDESDVSSFSSSIYNEKYSGHISTSSRTTMNIANAAMSLGYNDPKGSLWSVCGESKLQDIADLLTEQKSYVITRYSDSRNLDRMFNGGELWLFPEFSDAFRRLAADDQPVRHKLLTDEGGLGWLENWMMTTSVTSEAKKNAVYAFMNWRLQDRWMKAIGEEVGGAPSVDLRDQWSDEQNRIYFQDRTDVFSELTQFDIPECPEAWEEYWTQIQAA